MNETIKNGTDVPLCVDLDGTLLRTDTLVESIGQLIKNNVLLVFMFPFWLIRGRAYFKEMVASRVTLDVDYLPVNDTVIELIAETRSSGRPVILCTGANYRHASFVAEHLNLFDDIISSDAAVNLTHNEKQKVLLERFGDAGYDFVGNDRKDIPAMVTARKAYLVWPTRALLKKVDALREYLILDEAPIRPLSTYLSQMRLHQWLKNLLIFVPLIAAQQILDIELLLTSIVAFVAFGFCASSVYILNDLMDLRADRRHPRKRHRPFASSSIPVFHGLLLIPGLLIAAAALASSLPYYFAVTLTLYLLVSLSYNLWAKDIAVLDTIFLAGLYTVRILAGAATIEVIPSFWLLAFSMFLFLSIALAKRYTELVDLDLPGEQVVPGRQYRRVDLNTLISQGAASGYAAVLVLALYINSDDVKANYSNPEIIWLACPVLLYWINKLWLNTQRREMSDDPLIWAITNRVSRGLGVALILLLLAAA